MKKFITVGLVLVSAPFAAFAQVPQATTSSGVNITVSMNPGLLPADFFYFLDRWGEALNMATTFNKEKKVKLHIEYAKERVAEMKIVLNSDKAVVEDISEAKKDFDERIAEATSIIKSEKESGEDVSKLAREIDDELDSSIKDLQDIFKGHKSRSSKAEEKIIALMVGLPKGDPQLLGLTVALDAISKEKDSTSKVEDDLDVDFTEEEDTLEDIMGKEISSRKHAARVSEMMTSLGGLIPGGAVLSAKALLKQADEANARGDFDSAKKLSKQAKDILEKASDVLEENESENEMEDGLDIDGSLDDSSVRNLEQELEKGDRMLDGLR